MILDTLEHAKLYFNLGENIAAGLRFLLENDLAKFPLGRVEIHGDEVYAVVQEMEARLADPERWEAHTRYADIHCVLEGQERVGWAPASSLIPGPYNEEQDYCLLQGEGEYIVCRAGQFLLCLPQDAHQPGLFAGSTHIRKVVVKVRVA